MVPEGYPLEKHRVNTKDGWVLNMYRIPHGKYRNNKPGPRPVVLLHHGITLSSACFTLLNANESMAYILADAGRSWDAQQSAAAATALCSKSQTTPCRVVASQAVATLAAYMLADMQVGLVEE